MRMSQVASEPTAVWALDQRTFKMTIMGATMAKRKRHESFVAKVPLLQVTLLAAARSLFLACVAHPTVSSLQALNEYQRLTIADALTPREFAAGEIILAEGSEGSTFYLIEVRPQEFACMHHPHQ